MIFADQTNCPVNEDNCSYFMWRHAIYEYRFTLSKLNNFSIQNIGTEQAML